VTIAPGGGSATVNVTSASLTTGATATLARVTLNSSDTEGSTALTLVASGVTDSTGFDYIAQTANGTVRVASGPGDVTGSGNPARDLDGNGLYEDVNGDGQQTFSDVIELAFILDNQDIAPFFDFDGSGDLAFSDVIELAFDL
jgi:PKD repeat protein